MSDAELEKLYKEYSGLGRKEGMETFKSADFLKWLKCSGLISKKFDIKPPNRVDYVYTYACTNGPGGGKGNKKMSFPQFLLSCKGIAKEKEMTEADVRAKFAAGSPTFNATKAEANRFNDDKSNYTGARKQVFNGDAAIMDKQAIRANRALQLLEGTDKEEAMKLKEKVNSTFAEHDKDGSGSLDTKELKACLASIKPGASDDALDFAVKNAMMSFDQNNDGKISKKEFVECFNALVDTLNAIGDGIQLDEEKLIRNKYDLFCETAPNSTGKVEEMDTARFAKLCMDTWPKVFPSTGTGDPSKMGRNKADIIHTKAVAERRENPQFKGTNTITYKEFKGVALMKITEEYNKVYPGSTMDNVMAAFHSSQPSVDATEAEYARFHDDKSTYTGQYVAKFGVEKQERTIAKETW